MKNNETECAKGGAINDIDEKQIDSYVKLLKEHKMLKYYKRPSSEFVTELNKLLLEINFPVKLSTDDFRVCEFDSGKRILWDEGVLRFSPEFTSLISPAIHEINLYHYTNIDAIKEILSTRTLRLYTIKKNIEDDEIRHLLKEFGLNFSLEDNNYKHTIASELFIGSFTKTDIQEQTDEYLWKSFAHGNGARLHINVKCNTGIVRALTYGTHLDKFSQAFKEISKIAKQYHDAEFVMLDLATFCGCALPQSYSIEKEIRILARRSIAPRLLSKSPGDDGDYMELKFGDNVDLGLSIELIDVQTDLNLAQMDGVRVTPRTSASTPSISSHLPPR